MQNPVHLIPSLEETCWVGRLAGWGPLSVEIIVHMMAASPLPPKAFFSPLTSFYS